MSDARSRLPARRVPLALSVEGERWTCRLCPEFRRPRMMPDGERVCLHCQEGVRPQVSRLPSLSAIRERVGYTLANKMVSYRGATVRQTVATEVEDRR